MKRLCQLLVVGPLTLGVVSLASAEEFDTKMTGHAALEHGYGSVGYVSVAETMAEAKTGPKIHMSSSHGYEDLSATFRVMLEYQEIASRIKAQEIAEMNQEPIPTRHVSADWQYGYGAVGYLSLAATLADSAQEPRVYADDEFGYNKSGYDSEQFFVR